MLQVITGNIKNMEFENAIMFPENGKHPDEQIKVAQNLVARSKTKNIIVVTYSAVLIDALDAIGKFLNVPIDFYLCDGGEKYLYNDSMYVIYQDLGYAYEKITNIELENDFGLCKEHNTRTLNKILEDD